VSLRTSLEPGLWASGRRRRELRPPRTLRGRLEELGWQLAPLAAIASQLARNASGPGELSWQTAVEELRELLGPQRPERLRARQLRAVLPLLAPWSCDCRRPGLKLRLELEEPSRTGRALFYLLVLREAAEACLEARAEGSVLVARLWAGRPARPGTTEVIVRAARVFSSLLSGLEPEEPWLSSPGEALS